MKPPRKTHPPDPSASPLHGEEGFGPVPDADVGADIDADINADAALWDLLGKADKPVPVSPFFARNVVREIRLAEERKRRSGFAGALHSLLARWRPVTVGIAAAAVAILALSSTVHPPASIPESGQMTQTSSLGQPGQTAQASRQYDAEIIAQLDELLDDESVWLDTTVSAF